MKELMFLGLIDEEFFYIMWAIGLIIIFCIITAIVFSNRQKDKLEDFRRNYKIGIARTLGALTTIYFLILIVETIIYFINL